MNQNDKKFLTGSVPKKLPENCYGLITTELIKPAENQTKNYAVAPPHELASNLAQNHLSKKAYLSIKDMGLFKVLLARGLS